MHSRDMQNLNCCHQAYTTRNKNKAPMKQREDRLDSDVSCVILAVVIVAFFVIVVVAMDIYASNLLLQIPYMG